MTEETFLRAIITTTPVLLAVHGSWILATTSSRPWQWVSIVVVAAVGLLAIFGRRGDTVRIGIAQAVVLSGAAAVFIGATGGTGSFFLLWFFVIVAVYALVVPLALGVALSLALPSFYLLTWTWTSALTPAVVVWSRALLLAAIGLLAAWTAAGWRRSNEAERRFHRLFDASTVPILVLDGACRVVTANRRAEEMLGLGAEELAGRSFPELCADAEGPVRDLIAAVGRPSSDPERTWSARAELLGRFGTIPVELVAFRLGDATSGWQTGVIAIDLTRQLEATRELQRHEEELRRLIRSKDELIASISHEIRTPLTAIVGFARLLADDAGEFSEADHREMLAALVRESADLSDIVDDLLVAANAEMGRIRVERRPFDLLEAARQVVGAGVRVSDKRVQVRGESVVAAGDPARVRQVLRNLLANALRYGGEEIVVETAVEEDAGSVLVKDSGPPIPANRRAAIFEAYERGGGPPGLTAALGLGLYISRRLARLMGGDLVYEHDGRWSIFRLVLPVPEDQARSEPAG